MSDMQKNGVQLEDFVIATDDAEGFGLRGGAPFEPEVLHALRQYIHSQARWCWISEPMWAISRPTYPSL